MKAMNTPGNNNTEQPKGPKIRNMNEEREIFEEKPTYADRRLIIGAIVLGVIILIVGIKGMVSNASLSSKLTAAEKQLGEVKNEALLLGITQDKDGEVITPEIEGPTNVSDVDWDTVEARNDELLKSFTKTVLNYDNASTYEKARETLIQQWGFADDSRLMSSFMPPLSEGQDPGQLSFNPSQGMEMFVLENNGKEMTYFLICEVYNTINNTNGRSTVTGKVGVRVTIKEDGSMTNVSVQTLAQKAPKK